MLSQMIERLKKHWRRRISLSTVLAGGALLGGCATLGFGQNKPPVMVSEVVRMSEEGLPPETIVNKMRDSETVYRLSAAQLAQLHDQGVQDQVINYMQETYLNAARPGELEHSGNVGRSLLVSTGLRKQPARKINENPLASKESGSSC